MEKKKLSNTKECDFCNIKAIYLCFICKNYFCEICYKIIHELKKNSQHQKELIDPYIPIEINCPEHPKYPLELFCIDEKGIIIILIFIFIYII